MTCIKEKLLQKYIDGECTKKQREKVKHHLTICHSCEKKLAEMEELSAGIKRVLNSLTREPVVIPSFREPESLKMRGRKLLLYSLPAACILVMVFFLVNKNTEPSQKRITIVRNIPADVDANRPASDQDFVIEIYESKDQE